MMPAQGKANSDLFASLPFEAQKARLLLSGNSLRANPQVGNLELDQSARHLPRSKPRGNSSPKFDVRRRPGRFCAHVARWGSRALRNRSAALDKATEKTVGTAMNV
jgi:hypothetical protein